MLQTEQVFQVLEQEESYNENGRVAYPYETNAGYHGVATISAHHGLAPKNAYHGEGTNASYQEQSHQEKEKEIITTPFPKKAKGRPAPNNWFSEHSWERVTWGRVQIYMAKAR